MIDDAMRPVRVLLFVLSTSLLLCLAASAQDTIALKSGRTIIAPIDEVGEAYILYAKLGEDGKPQNKMIARNDIRRINYKNGYVERFDQKDGDSKDQIALVNGVVLAYKVIELNDNSVLVDAGKKDSLINLQEIATIAYANGYVEKYNVPVVTPAAAPVTNASDTAPPVVTAAVTTDRSAHAVPVRPRPGERPPSPGELLKQSAHSSKNKKDELVQLDVTDKKVMGIGYIVDSISNISNQFYLYDLLTRNQLVTHDQKKIVPVLTLRRGMCDYYISGTIKNPESRFYLWEGGQLKAQIDVNTPFNFVYGDLFKSLYVKIASVLADQPLNPKSVKVSLPDMPLTDFASTKDIQYNVLLDAANYTPPLDDYPEISREYLKPVADIDTLTLSHLLSYSFSKLSQKNKNKDPQYLKYNTALEVYAKILPQYPEAAVITRKEQIPVYLINESLQQRTASAETIKYLECLYPMYTSKTLKGFFFESSFVDDKAKDAARTSILPLYKRPGTALTYLQCGKDFAKIGAYDAAIESLSCGLLIVDNLNTTATFKEYLKASLFEELSGDYAANNQMASSVLCKNLAGFHHRLCNSHIFDTDNQYMNENTQKLIGYFEKVQSDALEARSKRRSATWLAILSTAATVASAAGDAAAGASTVSTQTVAFSDAAAASFSQASDIKQASMAASAQAAEIFNQSFGQMVSQLHVDNPSLSTERPLFTMDFISLISDKYILNEIGGNLNDFLAQLPFLKPMVNSYLNGTNGKGAVSLNDIYMKLGKMELELYEAEAAGKATTQNDLYTYR